MKFWVIISLLLAAAVARAGEPIPGRGAALYAARCAFCHGPTGHGNGPSGRTMKPRPTDFTSGPGARLTPDRVRAAIVQGVPGSPMVAYGGVIPDADLDALVRFVTGFYVAEQRSTEQMP